MQAPQLTDLEQAKRDLYQTRMAMIAQSRLALGLLEEKTQQQMAALEVEVTARLHAEHAKGDGAEVVELRRDGPVPVDESTAA